MIEQTDEQEVAVDETLSKFLDELTLRELLLTLIRKVDVLLSTSHIHSVSDANKSANAYNAYNYGVWGGTHTASSPPGYTA